LSNLIEAYNVYESGKAVDAVIFTIFWIKIKLKIKEVVIEMIAAFRKIGVINIIENPFFLHNYLNFFPDDLIDFSDEYEFPSKYFYN